MVAIPDICHLLVSKNSKYKVWDFTNEFCIVVDANPRQARAAELSSQCLEAFSEVGISMGYNNRGLHKERVLSTIRYGNVRDDHS